MLIRPATPADVPLIHRLAHEIWPATYATLMSAEQLAFMLMHLYSAESLYAQFSEMDFYIAERSGLALGFAALSLTSPQGQVFKLHKLYLLPQEQGKGSGRELVAFIEDAVRRAGGRTLELNVKRDNPAFGFYRKLGFEVYEEVDIPFFGFTLNDFVLRKPL